MLCYSGSLSYESEFGILNIVITWIAFYVLVAFSGKNRLIVIQLDVAVINMHSRNFFYNQVTTSNGPLLQKIDRSIRNHTRKTVTQSWPEAVYKLL